MIAIIVVYINHTLGCLSRITNTTLPLLLTMLLLVTSTCIVLSFVSDIMQMELLQVGFMEQHLILRMTRIPYSMRYVQIY